MPPNNQPQNQFSQFPPRTTFPPENLTGQARPTMPQTPVQNPVPPPKIPTIQMNPSGGHNKFIKPLLIILVIVIVLAGALALMRTYKGAEKQNFSSENVKVEDNKAQTPSGLPKDIPIEEKNILQSSTLNYPDRKATLYSVLFTSLKQTEELYAVYQKYLASSGFVLLNEAKSSAQMSFRASKDMNELSIVLTPQQLSTAVQISYIIRK
mgnify:CR=1 FL=1